MYNDEVIERLKTINAELERICWEANVYVTDELAEAVHELLAHGFAIAGKSGLSESDVSVPLYACYKRGEPLTNLEMVRHALRASRSPEAFANSLEMQARRVRAGGVNRG